MRFFDFFTGFVDFFGPITCVATCLTSFREGRWSMT